MCDIKEKEIWKDIDGYEGYYQISNYGRVKSLERDVYYKDGNFSRHKPETIKTLKTTKDGYLSVTLSVNCSNKTFAVHLLVANAFIDKPESDEKLEVNHIDLDRKNNHANNLEWLTHSENVSFSSTKGRYKDKRNGKDNGRSIPIHVESKRYKISMDFDTKTAFAEWIKEFLNLPYSFRGIFSGISKSMIIGRPYRSFLINYL